MKNQNQQHEALKGFYVQDTETENEKIHLRGRPKRNGQKRPVARKAARKTVAAANVEGAAARPKAPKNTAVRKSVSRFVSEGTLFRDSLHETTFGNDDYQFRKEMELDRFADDDINSGFTIDGSRSLPMELDEEKVQGTYSDQQLVQEIRRAIERDSAVSSSVQKIQITAKNGVVIVKGTVSSEQEQLIIEDKAVALAGFGQVVNQLEVIEDIIE